MNIPDVDCKRPVTDYNTGQEFLHITSVACEALIACSKQLDIIGRESGSEDYGTNLAHGAMAIKDAIQREKVIGTSPFAALMQISYILRTALENFQGQTYCVFFEAAAKAFLKYSDCEQLMPYMWLDALSAGNRAIIESGKLSPGNRNMLDALVPAQLKLAEELTKESNLIDMFGAAVQAAEESAIKTTCMKSVCGKKFTYPDPGAHAVGIWMRGAYEATKLKLLQQGRRKNETCSLIVL